MDEMDPTKRGPLKEKRAAIEAMTNTALAPGGPLVPPPHPRQRVYHSTEPAFIS
jgi:hypothetical protein